jgi:hypothetical protein
MGLSYTNATIKGPTQKAIATYLEDHGRSVLVSPTIQEITVVYEMAQGSATLSTHFKCPVLLLGIYDDDILVYRLYISGHSADSYESRPGYFTGDTLSPRGGDARKLCRAFGVEGVEETIDAILRHPRAGYALEEHQALVAALGWPYFAAGVSGFMILEQPEILGNYGFQQAQVVKTGEYRDK